MTALRNEIIAAFEASDKFTVTEPKNISVYNLPAVFTVWGGRQRAGTSGFLREVTQVVVVMAPMQTDDPWKDANEIVDDAIEVIYTVDGTFPELLPIISTPIDPQNTVTKRQGSQGPKTFASAIIQVVN